jgi:hypothetical protein
VIPEHPHQDPTFIHSAFSLIPLIGETFRVMPRTLKTHQIRGKNVLHLAANPEPEEEDEDEETIADEDESESASSSDEDDADHDGDDGSDEDDESDADDEERAVQPDHEFKLQVRHYPILLMSF